MTDRSLIATGGVATVLAVICCATPLLAVVLGAIGLTAWIAKADYVVLPVLIFGVALAGVGLYRRQFSTTCSAKETDQRRS
jgi:mercuric ion transport protein